MCETGEVDTFTVLDELNVIDCDYSYIHGDYSYIHGDVVIFLAVLGDGK